MKTKKKIGSSNAEVPATQVPVEETPPKRKKKAGRKPAAPEAPQAEVAT